MNFRRWTLVIALALFAALAMTLGVAAQDNTAQNNKAKHHTYKVIDLGTFGGPNSYLAGGPPFLNNQGTVVGEADTNLPDPFPPFCIQNCLLDPAFAWQNGTLTNLGALAPGVDSFAFSINSLGQIVGLSENAAIDPLTGFPETRGVLWQNGGIIDLGTLGGNDSIANAINDQGQVVGGAINTTPDAFSICNQPFGLYPTQVHAVRWQGRAIRDLGTLGGDDSCALFINDRGQIAGFSYTGTLPNATTGIPTQDPFLWQDDEMIDLGSLGGTIGSPNGLNRRGQIVGQSNLAGDATMHAFFWDHGVLTDLGTLGGDNSQAFGINDAGEVAGRADLPGSQSHHGARWKDGSVTDLGTFGGNPCTTANAINSQGQIVGDAGVCLVGGNGWLWEHGGPMVDLNMLAIPGSGIHVAGALQINDRGEIVAEGVLPNGDIHSVLLVPQGKCDDACEARIAEGQITPSVIPLNAMTRQRARFVGGYHVPNPESRRY